MVLDVLRIIFGCVFILFLPGYAWSFVFFKKGKIDLIERIALNFGLSIALVPLTVFYLNYFFKVRINFFNVCLVVAVLTAIPVAILGIKSLFRNTHPHNRENEHFIHE